MLLTIKFRESDSTTANIFAECTSAGSYKTPAYWSMVFSRMRGTNEPFVDFYKRIGTDWSITVVYQELGYDSYIAGVTITEEMLTAILLKYPPKVSSLPK